MKPLILKSNVNLKEIVPQMTVAIMVVTSHFEAAYPGLDSHMITSANDSGHGVNSLHYRGGFCRALDFRTHQMFASLTKYDRSGALLKLRDKIQAALPNFDVVLEDTNLDNEHLHVEWDPHAL